MLGTSVALVAAARPWRWRPDDGAAGWITVAAYLAVAATAATAWWRCRRDSAADADGVAGPRATIVARTWAIIAVAMLGFAVGKQFGVQNHAVDRVRSIASSEGWYADRRPLQAAVVVGLAIVGAVVAVRVVRWLRPVRHEVGWAAAGVAALVLFVAVRAVSLHQIDDVLLRGSPVEVGTVVELVCIAVVGASAARFLRGATAASVADRS